MPNISTCISQCDAAFTTQRLIVADEIRFSEVISALSVALDITQGHPEGHSMRTALIGMRIAKEIHLPANDQSALFYALLLKDLGCSSNAAKMSYLFAGDDFAIKSSLRMVDWTKPYQCLKHCWDNCEPEGNVVDRLTRVASIASMKKSELNQISEIRCDRGAQIARKLQLPEATANAIYHLDEHWNGSGNPQGLKGEEINLLARICCLAQTVEVFYSVHGLQAGLDVAKQRRRKWFDPELVDSLLGLKHETTFWISLQSNDLVDELRSYEPIDAILLADEACLDRVAESFAMVVDAKSPWTFKHSTGVADIAVGIAAQMGCSHDVKRDVRRAGLLHDIGKLGVSNAILDKPGKPTEKEFEQIRKHPEYTQQILERVNAFSKLAPISAAHHERLDGRGYYLGQAGAEIHPISRILAVADVCEALSAKRPYRDAMGWDRIREILTKDAGAGVDRDCVNALFEWYERTDIESRIEDQLDQVDRLLSELR